MNAKSQQLNSMWNLIINLAISGFVLECLKSRLNRTKEDDELLTTSHNILKNANPMVLTMEAMHRYGNHRGLGSIVHALITLRKFSVNNLVIKTLKKWLAADISFIQFFSSLVRYCKKFLACYQKVIDRKF